MDVLFAYITVSTLDEARTLGRILVEEKLAACVNLFPQMESLYHWEGKVESANESVLIAKTRSDLRDALQKRILELHSYECPCVVFLPVNGGNSAYLEWIQRETKET